MRLGTSPGIGPAAICYTAPPCDAEPRHEQRMLLPVPFPCGSADELDAPPAILRLSLRLAVHRDVSELPARPLGGMEPGGRRRRARPLPPPDVHHHRVLSPVFLPPLLQRLAADAVRDGA